MWQPVTLVECGGKTQNFCDLINGWSLIFVSWKSSVINNYRGFWLWKLPPFEFSYTRFLKSKLKLWLNFHLPKKYCSCMYALHLYAHDILALYILYAHYIHWKYIVRFMYCKFQRTRMQKKKKKKKTSYIFIFIFSQTAIRLEII